MSTMVSQETFTSNFSGLERPATVVPQPVSLAFPTPEQESAMLAPFRREISETYQIVMAICAQTNAPDTVRNLIDALINFSGGEIHVKASDYQIGAAFYKDENARDAIKKRVQRWRKNLDKWQTKSGITLVQIKSGSRRIENNHEKNEPSEYRLIVLDMAAKVELEIGTDIESELDAAVQSVVGEMRGYPSRMDTPRKRERTPESYSKGALTWARKALETARERGYGIDDLVREMTDDFNNLLAEFAGGDDKGGTKASHLRDECGTDLDTISTISSSYLPNKEGVLVKNEVLPMVEYALSLARRGFRVFPVYSAMDGICVCKGADCCSTPAKHPRIMGWNKSATTDETTIRDWWRKWPRSNIGIATGEIVVLDVDPKSDGFESLESLESENERLPETLTARTGSGGRHYIFKCPDGASIRNLQASQKLGRGLDIRGENGFIVAAGSIHASGNRYEWDDESAPLVTMPAWLVEKLNAPAERPSVSSAQSVSNNARPAYWHRARRDGWPLDSNDESPVLEGRRNDFLFGKAIGLAYGGRSKDDVRERIERWNQNRCVPPVSDYELNKLIDSAWKWAHA